ncbi:hypothetical protein Tco_0676313 [Tanacetum coccineum]
MRKQNNVPIRGVKYGLITLGKHHFVLRRNKVDRMEIRQLFLREDYGTKSMGICYAKTHTLRGKVFNENRAEADLAKSKPTFSLSTKAFLPSLSTAWQADMQPQILRSLSKPGRAHICTIMANSTGFDERTAEMIF